LDISSDYTHEPPGLPATARTQQVVAITAFAIVIGAVSASVALALTKLIAFAANACWERLRHHSAVARKTAWRDVPFDCGEAGQLRPSVRRSISWGLQFLGVAGRSPSVSCWSIAPTGRKHGTRAATAVFRSSIKSFERGDS